MCKKIKYIKEKKGLEYSSNCSKSVNKMFLEDILPILNMIPKYHTNEYGGKNVWLKVIF